MRRIACILIALLVVTGLNVMAQESDVLAVDTLTTSGHSSTRWIGQLFDNGFHINDPSVDYPRFPRFLLKVYNWGDRTFNSYDPEYVVATGTNWKLQAKSNNRMQTYVFIFPNQNLLRMTSNFYADIGANLSFMAVSVGYMFNANELMAHNKDTRSYFNVNFTCARFTADYTHTVADGGVKLKRFGAIKDGHHVSIPMNGVGNSMTTAQVLYFFNHNQYSHAAANCYSKYQLRSAGTWMAGVCYNRQDVNIDFAGVPDLVWEQMPDLKEQYHFNYTDYMAIGGYGYNWVIRPKALLFNINPLFGIGYKYTNANSTDGRRDMVATSATMNFSLVYNHQALFCGLHARVQGWLYFNGNYTFLNSFMNFQGTVGVRF